MTRCEYCDHEFTNWMLRRDCPKCGQSIKKPAASYISSSTPAAAQDDGFDGTGFAVGMMTGVPLSPSRGISVGSMIGAALHSNPAHSAPAPSSLSEESFTGGGGSYGGGGASSSWDSSSSSSSDSSSSYSSSSDSGSSSSSSSD